MITVTITIADGGQGQVHEAVSRSDSLSISGFPEAEQDDIVIKFIAEVGEELVRAARTVER